MLVLCCVALMLVLAWGQGCTQAAEGMPPADAEVDAGATPSATAVVLDPANTLMLPPGQNAEIRVLVTPPGVHTLRFVLLGDAIDASLDADTRVTAADGRASVLLTAPHTATTFRLRATADGGPSAEVAVSVSGEGFASVLVRPSYKGIRDTSAWLASATTHAGCSELLGMPPEDGPIVATVDAGNDVRLAGLPVGPRIAVTLRAWRAVGGCVDITGLEPGDERLVEVQVADVPVDRESMDLAMTLRLTPDGSVWEPQLDEARDRFLDALMAPNQSEASALLAAIAGQVPDVDEFGAAREASGWDQIAAEHLDGQGELLRDVVAGWIREGLTDARAGHVAKGRLRPAGSSQTFALLALESFAGVDAELAGLPELNLISLAFEPGDLVHAGGAVEWMPTQLMAAAADAAAMRADPSAAGALDLLRRRISCEDLVGALAQGGPLPDSCEAYCMTAACEDALQAMWSRARATSGTNPDLSAVAFVISGTAQVDRNAAVTSWSGSWMGTLSQHDQTVQLKGSASAKSTQLQAR